MSTIYLDTKNAAAVLSISPRTLERWRLEGKGPAFHKFGKRALYLEDELLDWAAAQRYTSTSEFTVRARG